MSLTSSRKAIQRLSKGLSRDFSVSQANLNVKFSGNPTFNKILIANRGEIACRVIRTCRRMGIKTVAVHSDADASALHVRMADEAVCVGEAPSAKSYLNMDAILRAIELTGAEAVHPGYGFLSENAAFSSALEERGIKFIGPERHAIKIMGDKIQSKLAAKAANVSVIPGDTSVVANEEECIKMSQSIGYPVMVKASAGGGGKGMRIAWDDTECGEAFRLSTQEAASSFGDDRLFVEKFIEEPRHVEIQVLADAHGNTIYLNERECSIQRRNQKVIEEAPSVVLDEITRRAMGEQACQMARAVQYQSAGTVEFLVDKHMGFYFLEMNTRLQVEHPVTELTTGVDLVEHMIRVAAGEKLSLKQEDIGIHGWAIESRVYAENPLNDFLPSIGRLDKYIEPNGETNLPGTVRVDSGIVEGSDISIHYDPMISKLITHAPTRAQALAKMREALDSYVICGVTHNIPFLKSLCDHSRFIEGDITTKFIEDEYPGGFQAPTMTVEQTQSLVVTAALVRRAMDKRARNGIKNARGSEQPVELICTVDGQQHSATVSAVAHGTNTQSVQVDMADGKSCTLSACSSYQPGDIVLDTQIGEKSCLSQLLGVKSFVFTIQYAGSQYDVSVRTPLEEALYAHMPKPKFVDLAAALMSPMPGAVFSISVKEGLKVNEGDEVCILEAMKMQNVLRAPKSGVVKKVHVAKGDTISADDMIYE
eukprot:554763_1